MLVPTSGLSPLGAAIGLLRQSDFLSPGDPAVWNVTAGVFAVLAAVSTQWWPAALTRAGIRIGCAAAERAEGSLAREEGSGQGHR